VEVVALVGEARHQPLDRRRHRLDVGAGLVARALHRTVGLLEDAQGVGCALERVPGGIAPRRRRRVLERLRERGLGDPVHEVEPELLVVELADAVVAEQVGVPQYGDAAGAMLHH
jgi:hypothetical protein